MPQTLEGSWTGKLNAGAATLTVVIHIGQDADGNTICTMDSPDQGAKGIPAVVNYVSADSIQLNIPSLIVTFHGKMTGNELRGNFMQMGRLLPLTLTRGVEVVRRPQSPAPPYPYKTEEVTFTNETDHTTLAGTLTYPEGFERRKKHSVPVVLMITGSGLQNRDEEVFEHKPFLVIADFLARNGIASLRYDDRGFGASTAGDSTGREATTLDYKRDAEAGLSYLRSLKRFGKVGALGHSEGGCIVFMLGASKAADFVVSMAGVGVKGDSALTAQVNHIMQLQGQPTQLSVSQYRRNAQSANSPWIDWFLDYDPTPDIAATACPVMAINGDKDCQVLASLNLSAIKRALPQNPHTLIKAYPALNHLFQHCQTGLPTEYRNIEETLSPEVLKDMAEWINKIAR